MKGVTRFEKKDKLSPRFIRPFEILENIGALSYRVALPPTIAGVHNVFHISMLRKYMSNPSHVLNYEPLQLTPIMLYDEQPIQILEKQERRLRNKVIQMVKVKWLNYSEEKATWETKMDMRTRHPRLFGVIDVSEHDVVDDGGLYGLTSCIDGAHDPRTFASFPH
ncbi:uncharacterized protein [Primulina eburnea]|uniref:uncharacterized protein n=1 Tax=Primulina eburnea TaxID=1245227 RepID=UPI003C6BFBE3